MRKSPNQNFAQNSLAISHDFLDRYQLVYARRIAKVLLASPEKILNKARTNLENWLNSGAFEKGEMKALNEWKTILQSSDVRKIIQLLTENSDNGQRLRQSSPFVGILSKREINQIREECEKTESV